MNSHYLTASESVHVDVDIDLRDYEEEIIKWLQDNGYMVKKVAEDKNQLKAPGKKQVVVIEGDTMNHDILADLIADRIKEMGIQGLINLLNAPVLV